MRPSAITTSLVAAAALGVGTVVAAAPSLAAPGDVAAVTSGAVGVDFRSNTPELSQGVARDGSVLFTAIETSDIYVGLYVRRPDGTVLRADTNSAGTRSGNSPVYAGRVADDGRYVAFWSTSPVFGNPDGDAQLVLKDLVSGDASVLVDLGTPTSACPTGLGLAVADQAERVMFSTTASLDPGDTDALCDVYAWEAVTGTTRLLTPGSASLNGMGSIGLAMTPDARHVLYLSDGSSDPATPWGSGDLYLLDLLDGITTLESVDIAGNPLPAGAYAADLSDDASLIAFGSYSDATLQLGFQSRDVFLRDRASGTVVDPSVPSLTSGGSPSLSGDGSHLAVEISWNRLTTLAMTDQYSNVAVYDVEAGSWQLASHTFGDPTAIADNESRQPFISANGSIVAFSSYSLDLTGPIDPDAPATERRSTVFVYEVAGLTPPDADADGILDVVDADGGDGSQPGRFEDVISGQGPTSGAIASVAAGMTVTITDEADPSGVLVSVSGTLGSARLSVCGGFSLSLRAGTTTAITCGSVRTRVDSGEVVVLLPDGVTVTVPAGVEAYVDDLPDGSFAVDVLAAGPGQTVTIDNGGATATVGLDDPVQVVRTWAFLGFAAPVDGGSTVNVVKGGSVVPLRWRLESSSGPVLGLTQATATFARLDCASGAPLDAIEEVAARPSGLIDHGGGAYQLNWRTPASPGCGLVRLDLGDGVLHTASFRLR